METFVVPAAAGLLLLGWVLQRLARRSPGLRKPIAVIYVLLAVVYLAWRLLHTVPTEGTANVILGWLLIGVELIGITQTIAFAILFWRTAPQRLGPPLTRVPTVDVLIMTYNEPIDIVERTLVAATQLDYPEESFTVVVCDDGDRPAMRRLADKWGVRYLRRDGHDGAKGGNLNNALAHTDGEFIVTMDADMILKPDFLQLTLGHFDADPAVGFVQTPQAFHNPDVFQHNLYAHHVMRNDQDFFMRHIQPQRDLFGATIYIGSGAVFRRTALNEIGGFATDVITEDMATGLLLNNAGWRAVYVNKVLASGLAPETYAELIKQRIRWGRGNIQVFKKYFGRRLSNLNLAQRWLFLDGVAYWFFGVFQLLYLLFPIAALLFNAHIVRVDNAVFLACWAAQFGYSLFLYDSVAQGRFKKVWTTIYELAQAPQIATAVLSELLTGRQLGFQVTTKGQEVDSAHLDWRKAWPQLAMLALTCVAIVVFGYRVAVEGPHLLVAMAIPLTWAVFNMFALLGASLSAVDQPRFRHRLLALDAPGTLEVHGSPAVPVHLRGIHVQKACMTLPRDTWESVSGEVGATLHMADFAPVSVSVERVDSAGDFVHVFTTFDDLPTSEYAKLSRLLNELNTREFSHRPDPHRHGVYDATLGMVTRRIHPEDPILGGAYHPELEPAGARHARA